MAEAPIYLVVGVVRRPHGLQGAVTVTTTTDHPAEVFREGRTVYLADEEGGPAGGALTVRSGSPHKGGYLVQFREMHHRDQVDALRGRNLVIPATDAVAATEGEVFFHELVDLAVVRGGERVGVVREVVELPSGVALSVRVESGKEVLVPFVRSIVTKVDVESGVVEVDPPQGLLEL